MARAAYKLPNVFVGCPYSGPFNFAAFKGALDRVPFRWYYADTGLTTKHLLGILTSYISAVDYCIFDISTWNPNVALEIGLAEGLGVDYYILLNRRLKKNVPADIQGLQRIEYTSVKSLDTDGLIPQVVKYLVRNNFSSLSRSWRTCATTHVYPPPTFVGCVHARTSGIMTEITYSQKWQSLDCWGLYTQKKAHG